MTLNELAYNILNKMTGGRSTHNEYISLDQIKFNIHYYRSLLLHRELRRSQNKDLFEQNAEVNIETDSIYDFKSVSKIPSLIRFDFEYPISIRVNGAVLPVHNYHSFTFNQFNRYTSGENRAFLKGGIVYIKGDLTAGDTLYIRGIFEDPSEVYLFNNEDPLEVDNMEYPISGDMAQRISQSLINGDLELILKTPNDITHDNMKPAPGGA